MESVAFRCLHTVRYFEGVTGKGGQYWILSQNCFAETSSLLWCHIFNSRNNDPVHYWNLFGDDQLIDLDVRFSYDAVKENILTSSGIENNDYEGFRHRVVDFRNKYVSHREYESQGIRHPEYKKIGLMCEAIREILSDTVTVEYELNPADEDLYLLKEYYASKSNESILKMIDNDVQNAINSGV